MHPSLLIHNVLHSQSDFQLFQPRIRIQVQTITKKLTVTRT